MGRIIKRRLRLRPRPGGTSIDRWINFVVGDVDDDQVATLRGVVFDVTSEWDVRREMNELRALAKEVRAEGREDDFLNALDARGAPQGREGAPTFAEFTEEWEQVVLIADNVTAAELESTRSILRLHLVPFFGKRRLGAIDRRQIDRFKAQQRQAEHQFGTGYAASTINNQLSVLRRVFSRAQAYGLIEQVPMDETVWMRTERVEDDENWLPEEDEQRLALFLWENRGARPARYLALLVQLIAGLRFSELRALEKSDLDIQASGLHVRRSRSRRVTGTPKNKRARFQPLPAELVDALRRYMLSTDGQLLFTGVGGGHLIYYIGISSRRAAKSTRPRATAA